MNFDDKWKTIIGATGFERVSKMYCVCEEVSSGYEVSRTEITNPINCISGSGEIQCRVETRMEVRKWTKDSDGVVLAESASDIPGATWEPEEMEITSHMQMRNNVETERTLRELYNGGYDKWFRCESR